MKPISVESMIRNLTVAAALVLQSLAIATGCNGESNRTVSGGKVYPWDRPEYTHGMGSIRGSVPLRGGEVKKIGPSLHIQNVPVIHQMPRYPTGCEAVAMTMLLQWAGKAISVDEVIAHMPKGPKPSRKDGDLHAPDPREAFIGNPYDDKGSFGIYHQPLLRMLELYFPGRAVNLTGRPWREIEEHVAKGVPVVIWGTIKMLPMKPTLIWRTPAGESFQWKGNEHAMTMVGYDDTTVYVNDPYTGRLEKYGKDLFIDRWNSMLSQAISIRFR